MEDDLEEKKMEDDLKKKIKLEWPPKKTKIILIGCDTIVNSPSWITLCLP